MFVKILMIIVFIAMTGRRRRLVPEEGGQRQRVRARRRSVGPWLTAFAYGTSYFSAVIFVGYAGQFGWKYGVASTWIGIGNALIGKSARVGRPRTPHTYNDSQA